MPTPKTHKWKVLAVYSLAAGLSQCLWLNFAPVLSLIETKFAVTEDQAGLLLMVFPLTYVLLSLPAGALIDRRGYRFGIGVGVIVMAVFAALRAADLGFGFLLATQLGISLGQPFVVNGITKLVLDWFEPAEEGMATGIGTVGMFLGMAVGMSATPLLIDKFGWQTTLSLFAAVSIAIAALFLVVVHPNKPHQRDDSRITPHLRAMLGDRNLVIVFTLSFLGLGYFNGLTTWLEPILAPHGIDSIKAGAVGGAVIVGGIVGAALIPALSDHLGRRKPPLIGSIVAALALTYPLCGGSDFKLLLVQGAALGFFFLPAYALMLAVCSELAGAARAGAATGILMLTGNAGGVVIILLMQAVKSERTGFMPAIHLLAALLVAGIVLAILVRETGQRAKPNVVS